jgi:hypothetical protein
MGLFDEKNQMSKISWHCSFKVYKRQLQGKKARCVKEDGTLDK